MRPLSVADAVGCGVRARCGVLGGDLRQHLGERRGILRAGDPVLAVDDEERHALDAELLRDGLVGSRTSARYSSASSERTTSSRSKPSSAARSARSCDATDVAALVEVRLQQALLHLELAPAQLRVVDQLVRLHRVGVLQRVVVVVQSDGLGDAGHPGDHLLRPCRPGCPCASARNSSSAALEVDRGVGRQLEGVVLDLDRRRPTAAAPASNLRLPM